MGEINRVNRPGNPPPERSSKNAPKETTIKTATRVKKLANEHFIVYQGMLISSENATSLKGKTSTETKSSIPKNIKPH